MTKPIHMLLCVPKADDPTSFYRAFGPFAALRKEVETSFMLPSAYHWGTISMNDIVFLQRPADPQCVVIAEQAKTSGVPLWVDFDDDNLAVPKDNPTSDFFGRWDVKDCIVKCARMADVITVSTEFLRKKYSVYNKNVVLVPNAMDERYYTVRKACVPKRPKDKIIAWRGGPGFQENMKMIVPALISIAKRHATWKFVFMGYDPYEVTNHIKNYQFVPWISFMDYLKVLCQIHPTALVYCLKPNDHSLSRSHVAWLEASFAGAATVAYKCPEFTRPGCLNFESSEECEELLHKLITKELDADKYSSESWVEIEDKYLLSKINVKRKEIIEQLMSGN